MVLPGFMTLNARIMIRVLAKAVAIATVNNSFKRPLSKVAVLGQPMKSSKQRKHRKGRWVRHNWGLDYGSVSVLPKTHKTTHMMTQKHRAVHASNIPMASLKAKVTTFGKQWFVSLFGYSCAGHWIQCSVSGKKTKSIVAFRTSSLFPHLKIVTFPSTVPPDVIVRHTLFKFYS